MKKPILFSVLLSCCIWQGQAQDSTGKSGTAMSNFNRLTVEQAGLAIGSNGISAELTHQVKSNALLTLHAGYRFYQFDFTQDWGKRSVTTSPDVSTPVVGLGYDWFPFLGKDRATKFMQALKVKGGLQYVFNPEYKFHSRLAEDIKWGQTSFTQEQIGYVNTTVTTNKLQPFVAAGFDQFFRDKKLSFAADLGLIYQGQPDVEMKGTNMLEPTSSQAEVMERNLKSWQFFPYLSLKLNVKL